MRKLLLIIYVLIVLQLFSINGVCINKINNYIERTLEEVSAVDINKFLEEKKPFAITNNGLPIKNDMIVEGSRTNLFGIYVYNQYYHLYICSNDERVAKKDIVGSIDKRIDEGIITNGLSYEREIISNIRFSPKVDYISANTIIKLNKEIKNANINEKTGSIWGIYVDAELESTNSYMNDYCIRMSAKNKGQGIIDWKLVENETINTENIKCFEFIKYLINGKKVEDLSSAKGKYSMYNFKYIGKIRNFNEKTYMKIYNTCGNMKINLNWSIYQYIPYGWGDSISFGAIKIVVPDFVDE